MNYHGYGCYTKIEVICNKDTFGFAAGCVMLLGIILNHWQPVSSSIAISGKQEKSFFKMF